MKAFARRTRRARDVAHGSRWPSRVLEGVILHFLDFNFLDWNSLPEEIVEDPRIVKRVEELLSSLHGMSLYELEQAVMEVVEEVSILMLSRLLEEMGVPGQASDPSELEAWADAHAHEPEFSMNLCPRSHGYM